MKWWWSGLGLFLLAAAMVWFKPQRERAHGQMDEEVYVWQRVWDGSVHEAVQERGVEFGRVIVLGVEMDHSQQGGWQMQYFKDPISYAGEHPGTVIAVRIGVGAAKLGWDQSAMTRVAEVVDDLPDVAKVIQLDYDCPSSKLADYTRLLRALKKHFPEKEFEVTCLPDWLDQEEFAGLVAAADRYVMQVHGLIGYGSVGTLCDPEKARDAAERCDLLGEPFLIALPTYRHAVQLSKEGKILQVVSEGGRLRPGAQYVMAGADQQELAALVKQWTLDRPANMRGIVWYRMPVDSDRMNWTWQTLSLVRKGEVPVRKLSISVEEVSPGLFEVSLVNGSVMRENWPKRVEISFKQGLLMGGEGSNGYAFGRHGEGGAELKWSAADPRPMLPESSLKIGWLRVEDGKEMKVSLSP